MCVRVQTDATERIEALILDGSLDPLTGLSDILIAIRRVSDGYWFDFNDNTFKASGWTTRQQAMTETDATNDPGVYHYDFDLSAITNKAADDTYQVRVDQSPGTSAENTPQTGEIKEGDFIDHLDADITSRAPAGEYDTEMAHLDADITSRAPAGEYDTEMATLTGDIAFIKHIEGGRWQLTGTQMIFYQADNTTEVARFDITLDGNDNPIERTRV